MSKQNEIERKFLVKKLPDLAGIEKVAYERYYLFNEEGIELRIQRKGDRFELERKVFISNQERTRQKIEISQVEFELLKPLAGQAIIRDGYPLSDNPNISIKIYHGHYEGLIRAEVECATLKELQQFQPPDWFGPEITDSPLARDAELLTVSTEEFKNLLKSYETK